MHQGSHNCVCAHTGTRRHCPCPFSSLSLLPPLVFSFSRVYEWGVSVCECVCWPAVHLEACSQARAPWRAPASEPQSEPRPRLPAPLCSLGSSLMAACKLLLPPPLSCDAKQPPTSCLMGADSISQGAHLLPGPFIKSAGADGGQGWGGW